MSLGVLVDARVVTIVPSWNGRELLEATLDSLAAQQGSDIAVLVVDNGSTDGTAEHIRVVWPGVKVLRLPENVGFAAAVNKGIAASRGEFVALVNNDVEVEPGWGEALVRTLREDPSLASATGKIMDRERPDRFDGAGDLVGWDGYTARRGRGELDRGQFDRKEEVFAACAGASMYRRQALEEVGEFDETFFAYIEDVDWGFRAQLAGFGCMYEPAAVAHHRAGSTSGRISGFELYFAHRNMILMMVKNFPAEALILHAVPALGRRLLSLAKAARNGQGRIVLRAWRAAFRKLPSALSARRTIQANSTRRWSEMRRMLPSRAPLAR